MFRHDARVIIYAPLRMEFTQQRGAQVRFTVDQPGSQFDSFPSEAISKVGRELDQLVLHILEGLGVEMTSPQI